MSEMSTALGILNNLPQNHLMLNPAGSWSFVGRVHKDLRYWHRTEDRPLTDDEFAKVTSCGVGLYRATIEVRTWSTAGEARAAAAAIGQAVTE